MSETRSSKPRGSGGLARLVIYALANRRQARRPAIAVAGVALHVVIRRKNDSRLDKPVGWARSFELESIV
jgi:hypothetical protein